MAPLNHPTSHLPVPGLSFRDKKTVGDSQLSDLGLQRPDQLLIHLRRESLAAALEDIRGPVEQHFLPLVDHRRMHAVFGRQIRHGALASSATRILKPASWFLRFRISDLLVLGDQQMLHRSFGHCPISRE